MSEREHLTRQCRSWVIVVKDTGKAVMETDNPTLVAAINTARYEAVPAYDYLRRLNKEPAP